MPDSFYQKDLLFNRNSFKIQEEGVLINSKSLFKSEKYFMNFEDIGIKFIKSKSGKKGWLIATLFFLILALGLLILEKIGGQTEKSAYVVYLIFAIISGIIFLITYKRSFYLANSSNENAIEFLIDKPSKEELKEFIDILKNERKKVLLTKYGQLNNLISYEKQLNNLNWLNTEQALTKSEYESKMLELNALFKRNNPVIGFRSLNDEL